ncbi:MAG: isocitrate lyase/phosphoenolpyruvate mutase family protein [Nannocystaceae bacterium]|nr:isocitrate lyase/phosphoenolpyruvate mutase family protein [Myxococcales bacterium]
MRSRDPQVQRAAQLLALHHQASPLVLPNAWDVASARIFAAAGAAAIGTTSMGIAAAAGYPDEEQLPLAAMLDVVARVVAAVDIPVSADLERGYGETPAAVGRSVLQVIDAGAVGVNLEDATGDPSAPLLPVDVFVARIAAARDAAQAVGVPLVINARTDVFLAAVGDPATRLARAIERGNRCRRAGADCVFVPGGLDRETIAALVRGVDAPINVVANPAISSPVVPSIAELAALGVSRVSLGSGPMRATLALTLQIAEEVLGEGRYDAMKAALARPSANAAYAMAIGEARRPG